MIVSVVGGFHAAGDVIHGGRYRLSGTVDELGADGKYRIRCYLRRTGEIIREVWSDASGAWEVRDLAYVYQGYFVVAFDHGDNPVQAAAADFLTPEPYA